jgi:hypothetical protein
MLSRRQGSCWAEWLLRGRTQQEPIVSLPIEVRSDVGATLAVHLADEARLDLGQPKVVSPGVVAERDRVAGPVVRAVRQNPAHTALAHVREGNFSWRAIQNENHDVVYH